MGVDVCDGELCGFVPEVAEHFRLDIDGDDLPFRDEGGDAEAVVAGASSDIGDDGVWSEFEEGDCFGWCFFLFSFGTFEPADAGVTHDVGNFATHEDFPDAILGW